MTEYFKQIVDAWGDRLRSPVLGSILIFFVATNWQSLFYLFFADKPVRARLLYFDANTDGWSLYGLPVIGGVVLAIAVPWISLAGAFLAKFPRSILHSVQSSEAQKRRIAEYRLKAEAEEAMAFLEDASERRKIEAAKRLNEAEAVSDELKMEIEWDRAAETSPSPLRQDEIKILEFAKGAEDGRFEVGGGSLIRMSSSGGTEQTKIAASHLEEKQLQNILHDLMNNDLLDRRLVEDGWSYEITLDGYSALERLEKK
jgi:predicted transcriptional regulator